MWTANNHLPSTEILFLSLVLFAVGLYAANLPAQDPISLNSPSLLETLSRRDYAALKTPSRRHSAPLKTLSQRDFTSMKTLNRWDSSLLSTRYHPIPAEFSFKSVLDSVQTAVNPIVSGPNKCDALKSLFGFTYEQMQEKNNTMDDALNIDLITKNGNVKYNLSVSRRLNQALENKTIVILVHGFLENSEGLMVNGLSPGLLRQPDLRTLALDGRRFMYNLEYLRSSTYARFIGDKLGDFLNEIVTNGHNPSQLILIGHSLGAHIAGIAGKRLLQLSGQLPGRIMGLDPAAPCFATVGPAGRLEKTDAEYVMVIHTNGGMLGLLEPVGHTDWYPNGGQTQPGCYLSTCSHSRAWELLAESIVTPDHFPARKCSSWQAFKDGQCTKNHLVYLGLNLQPPPPGNYYFSTAPEPPYGLGPTGSG